ncbi:MAG TPA: gliding motility-associated C-terminal domain-containing protein, partial [Bacteroidia bacterium]|nr:gliding motility-associated C-terminal domain-containing protein [Bacteroidia bacterium]
STVPDNSLGSLIRLTIGAPHSNAETITSYDFNTFAPRDTFCVGDIVALFFSPYNYSDHSTYMWQCNGINGGNPFVSPSGANSNSLYVNLNGAGVLIFRVQETNYGCTGSWSPFDTIVVLGPPNVTITGPHFVCQGDTDTYTTLFNNNTYYSWGSTGGNIVDTSNNVIDMSFPNTGNFQITLNAINQCASLSSVYNVTVNPYPAANAGNDTVICSNTPVPLSTPTGSGYVYSWSDGTSTISTSNAVVVSPTVTTTYVVSVSIVGGCTSHDTVTVIVNSIDDTTSTTQAGCNVNDATATVTPTSGVPPYTYLWSNGQTTQTAVALAPGTYTCTVTDALGCSYSSTVVITSISSLNPDAGPTATITAGQSTQLNGSGGVNYSWSPSTGLSCTNCQNPLASPSVTTTYTLTVTDSTGCPATDTVTVFVDIDCGTVFVPNAFSPNGDNQNDVLFVRGACIQYMDFSVYNRWGERVFHSTDPAVGWDGTWRGVPCEDAVFMYVLKGTLLDGTQIDQKGNVSLIK